TNKPPASQTNTDNKQTSSIRHKHKQQANLQHQKQQTNLHHRHTHTHTHQSHTHTHHTNVARCIDTRKVPLSRHTHTHHYTTHTHTHTNTHTIQRRLEIKFCGWCFKWNMSVDRVD